MDKRIFKIRRKLHKQIIFILLIFFSNSCTAQENPSSVFEKGKIVGEISKNTSYECSECYIFKPVKIYNKVIRVKIPVSTVELQKNRLIFRADYEVSLKNNSKNIIEVASTYTAKSFKLFIAKDKNDLYVNKIEEFSNASYKYKIAADDFVDIPATLICQDIFKNKKIVTEYFDVIHFLKNNTINKECFHCPVEYSIDQCLKMKAESKPFLWNQ